MGVDQVQNGELRFLPQGRHVGLNSLSWWRRSTEHWDGAADCRKGFLAFRATSVGLFKGIMAMGLHMC